MTMPRNADAAPAPRTSPDATTAGCTLRLVYYKSKVGNFGDDLNVWLWPRLIPSLDAHATTGDRDLIAIGSILARPFVDPLRSKIIFGAGARGRDHGQRVDDTWDVRFVRGRWTAEALGLDPARYAVTDAAAALHLVKDQAGLPPQPPTDNVVGFMPHFYTMDQADWPAICARAGVRLIDSRGDVPTVLRALAGVRRLITEAMHGAIVGDILRVPWVRVRCHSFLRETPAVSEFKWADWSESLGISYATHALPTVRSRPSRRSARALTRPFRAVNELRIASSLRRLAQSDAFTMSTDDRLLSAVDRIDAEIRKLNEEIGAGLWGAGRRR
jgi:hypothetical protein